MHFSFIGYIMWLIIKIDRFFIDKKVKQFSVLFLNTKFHFIVNSAFFCFDIQRIYWALFYQFCHIILEYTKLFCVSFFILFTWIFPPLAVKISLSPSWFSSSLSPFLFAEFAGKFFCYKYEKDSIFFQVYGDLYGIWTILLAIKHRRN